MSVGPTFTGAGTSAATAMDFLKDVELGFAMRGVTGDAEKLAEVKNRFRYNSPADTWFRGANHATWAAFTTAFEARFASIAPVSRPREQKLAELAGMRRDVGGMGAEYVMVGGERVAPMAAFRARVNEAVIDAAAETSSEGVWAFWTALPAMFQMTRTTTPANWNEVLTALAAIPQVTILAAATEYNRAAAVDAHINRLDRAFSGLRVTPPAKIPTPVQNNPPQTQNAGAAQGNTQTPNNGGGGARRGPRGPVPAGTDEQRARLMQIMTTGNSQQPPNTPEGRARHAEQVAAWHARNGQHPPDTVSLWSTGFPISPGTALPCSGECWTCGMVVPSPSAHRPCTVTSLPVLERKYRALCGNWFGKLNPPPVVNRVEVEEVEGTPWYEDEVETQQGDF
ncbi:hypothetical protein C8R45DRAFT_1109758 [Mycena sanguinolenta]|nr:hypothetical protein C8R45DRAFT_1109758 [Mycena sanguinolenta]